MQLKEQLILAVVSGIFAIIVIILGNQLLFTTYEVKLINEITLEEMPGTIRVDNKRKNHEFIPNELLTIRLMKGKRFLWVESPGCELKKVDIDSTSTTINIKMKKDGVILPEPLPMVGWKKWNEITLTSGNNANELIINSNGKIADAAGFFNNGLVMLNGKTLILYFSNTAESTFLNNQMIKLEFKDDDVLFPDNSIIVRDFLPAADTPPGGEGIQFTIPNDFTGRINFTFYQAEINDLKITAWYR